MYGILKLAVTDLKVVCCKLNLHSELKNKKGLQEMILEFIDQNPDKAKVALGIEKADEPKKPSIRLDCILGGRTFISSTALDICGTLGMSVRYMQHPVLHEPGLDAALKPVATFVDAFVRLAQQLPPSTNPVRTFSSMENLLQLEFPDGKCQSHIHLGNAK